MTTLNKIADVGGVFALLVFWHFFADWLFQSHKEALAKSKDSKVRLRHCAVYTGLFLPAFLLAGVSFSTIVLCSFILFSSHYVIDTYIPVMLWAKYLRKAPQFETYVFNPSGWVDNKLEHCKRTDEESFKAFASTPLGLILMITMDQFFHIAFLIPVAWLAIG